MIRKEDKGAEHTSKESEVFVKKEGTRHQETVP